MLRVKKWEINYLSYYLTERILIVFSYPSPHGQRLRLEQKNVSGVIESAKDVRKSRDQKY